MSLFVKKNVLSQAALNADNDGLIVFNQMGKIRFANKAAAQMVGYNDEAAMLGGEILETVIFKVRDDVQARPAREEIVEAVQNDRVFSSRDYEVVSAKGGAVMVVDLLLSPFVFEGEKMFFLKMRNMTKDIERERAQAEFISTASHEMRTPVAAIQGYLGLALNPKTAAVEDARARELLQSAMDATNRLGELFKNLLDVSRLDGGKLQPQLKPMNVRSVILNLKKDFEVLAYNRKQSFVLDAGEQDAFCNLDFTFFHDILMDLVDNAMKYTPSGGQIKVKMRVGAEAVAISVSDNGMGISEDDLGHIFQRFYRSQNSNLKVGGTGLGLFLIKQRTEMMGGKIDVKSVYGEGSTFTVTFPRITDVDSGGGATLATNFSVEQIFPLEEKERELANYLEKESQKKRAADFVQELSAMPFIKMAEKWKRGAIPPTDDVTKQKIYAMIRKENQEIPQEQFDAFWVKMNVMLDNPGLAKIITASVHTPYNFVKSAFIIPWMARQLRITTWEFSFGYNYDYAGNWREFPKSDPAYQVAVSDPEFRWARERAIMTRKEIAGKERVLFLYAGCLPELRNVGYYSMPQEVWACDDDPEANTKEIFGWFLAEHNVHYEISGAADYVNKMAIQGRKFDTIVLNGASIVHFGEFEAILLEAVKLLKPGGKILFDVQFMHWDLMRAWNVFGVAKNSTVLSNIPYPEEAMRIVMEMCRKLPNVRLKYAINSSGKPYVGALFYVET